MWRDLTPLLFWLSFAILGFTYIGYPAVIYFLGKVFSRKKTKPDGNGLPEITIVLAAFNEEQRVIARLQNLLASDYPAEKLNIILVTDGASDSTAERAESLGDARIKVLAQPQRAGKASCLNLALTAAKTEIIVFGDVRQRFAPDAIKKLVLHFTNPEIGAVSGSLEIDSASSAIGGGVDAYWKLEKFLRFHESRLDSSIGCTGAIYAIRRNLFQPIPPDTLLDDVVIPMQIAAQGARVIFEPTALAFDPQSLEPEREWVRKQRTLAGNYQMMFRYFKWVLPGGHRLWWQLISHKYLRLAAPWFMALMLAVNFALIDHPVYRLLFCGQCAFYLLAVCGKFFSSKKVLLFSVPAGFVFLNLTALRGLWHYLQKPSQAGWQSASLKVERN